MKGVPYLSAVGSLMYLAMCTRPDIAYTVSVLSRFGTNPGVQHWKAVKHLFRYLRGTVDLKLTYRPAQPADAPFVTYSDADHGGNKDNGRSTGGYLVCIGSGAVSWSSKQQPIVTLSTTEAECVTAVQASKEISGCTTYSLRWAHQSTLHLCCTLTPSLHCLWLKARSTMVG